jgi:hypothetical protein
MRLSFSRTEEYREAPKRLNEFLMSLPLSNDQGAKLLQLAGEQVRAAETGAFEAGREFRPDQHHGGKRKKK